MSYQVLARKWRPRSFDQVVGQQHVLQALINALDQQRLHHAYLFTGTRGVGKTSIARLLAKALNCEQSVSSKPCGQCQSCVEIDNGNFIDLIEVDAASKTKVEDTRDILDNVQYKPTRGRYKVYLIDEVHMLSRSSFNALLKTLEEPPEHVKFLFATTEAQKLPITILSRCLQFNLKAITASQIAGQLSHILDSEHVSYDSPSLRLISDAAAGSMRDALSLADQAIAFGNGTLAQTEVSQMLGTLDADHSAELVMLAAKGQGELLFSKSAELIEFAPDYDNLLKQMAKDVHLAAMSQIVKSSARSANDPKVIVEMAAAIEPEMLQLFYHILLQGRKELEFAPDSQSGFEMVLLRLLAFVPKEITDESDKPQTEPEAETELKVLADQQNNILQQAGQLRSRVVPKGPAATAAPIPAKTEVVEQAVTALAKPVKAQVSEKTGTAVSTSAQPEAVEQTGTAAMSDQTKPATNARPELPPAQFSEQELMNMSYAMAADDDQDYQPDLTTFGASDSQGQVPAQSSVSREGSQSAKGAMPAKGPATDLQQPIAGINDFVNARKALREQLNKGQDATEKKPVAVKTSATRKTESSNDAQSTLPPETEITDIVATDSSLPQTGEQGHNLPTEETPLPVSDDKQHNDKLEIAEQNVVVQSSAEKEFDPATILVPNTDDRWSVMVDEMGIGGRLRLLAIQSSYSQDQQNIALLLRAEHRHLLAPNALDQLQQYIRKYLNQEITLTIDIGSDEQLTPDQIATNLHQKRLALAVECIETDSFINQFEQQFDAQLNKESINYRSLKKVS